MDVAIALLPLGLVTAAYVWQSGRTERQRLAINWQRERLSVEQEAASRRFLEEKAEALAKYDAVAKRVEDMEATLKRFVEGREVIRRAS